MTLRRRLLVVVCNRLHAILRWISNRCDRLADKVALCPDCGNNRYTGYCPGMGPKK